MDHGQVVLSVSLSRSDESTSVAATKQLEIRNVAPTATIVNSGPIARGAVATIRVDNVLDPSTEDLNHLRYSYDFNNDGDYNDVGERFLTTARELVIPSRYLENLGSHTIGVRINDDEGA
ncbi:MAG: hypothetical protein IT423_19600, partial [Pirellulaceae bacterium]|nr:hypothetical protein [Pirellulaceae bacterium]